MDLYKEVSAEAEHRFNESLFRARFAYLHETNLMSNAESLESVILDSYRAAIGLLRERVKELEGAAEDEDALVEVRRNLSMLLSEFAHPLIQHWKYDECEASIDEAFELAGINV